MNKILSLLFVFALAAGALAQEPLSNYKDRTVAQITELNKSSVEAAVRKSKQEEENDLQSADPLYSKVSLQFLAAARPIAEGRKKLISNWGKSLKIEKKTTELYVNELKFAEGEREYWIGIPNSLIPMIAGKVKKGELVSLYLSYAGAFKPKDQKEYESVLIITAVQ